MAVSRFPISAKLERPFPTRGTVTICRDTNLLTIRPYRCRRTYTSTLDAIAGMIVQNTLAREARERVAEKRARRKRGGAG